MQMGLQKLLILVIPFLLLSSFLPHHCHGNRMGPMSFGDAPRRSLLASSSSVVVSVDDYGAKGDGSSDDTTAFMNAWKAVCSSSQPATLLVPESKTYNLKPIIFKGPCNSNLVVNIQGTILASSKLSDWDGTDRKRWLVFSRIKNLIVQGGGTFDGNGQTWWKNSCKVDKSKPCTNAPTAVTFDGCTSLKVDNLNFKNSQKMHVTFDDCVDVQVSNLDITAPGNSPNTDGIHVTGTTNIQIRDCVIGTGDDCISIVSGSRFVNATNIFCGPGHGISIGSLGANGAQAAVSDIWVDTAQIDGATNGVRIKTWQGGKGYAKNINFENVIMKNVKNPIIIDQNYCDSNKPCGQQSSAVAISGVKYKNIRGTSATSTAIEFDCSKSVPCTGIVLQDINLTLTGGGSAKSICSNVKVTKSGTVIPAACN